MISRRAIAIYAAALALMLVLLAALWWAPGPLAAWRQWQAPPPQAPNLDDVRAAVLRANPAAAALSPVVTERPLFNDTRRAALPATSAASAPKRAPSPIEQARLQGVIAGPTLSGVMLEEGGKARFVRERQLFTVIPPSTTSSIPVMYFDSSDAKNSAALAMSSASTHGSCTSTLQL